MPKKLKKDFDRDKMYSKIMPTVMPDPQKHDEDDHYKPLVPDEASDKPLLELELSGPRMHNYMEDLIKEKLPNTMNVLRSCPCERCQLDIMAISLNSLPPAYAVTEKDDGAERTKRLRREYEVKVTATLIKAIQQVKNSPRHDGTSTEPEIKVK